MWGVSVQPSGGRSEVSVFGGGWMWGVSAQLSGGAHGSGEGGAGLCGGWCVNGVWLLGWRFGGCVRRVREKKVRFEPFWWFLAKKGRF